MKLLLDEMYPPAIAEQLRRRGHDVDAVTARREIRMLADPDLFAAAQAERRALVTENVVDFVPVADGQEQRGQAHHGLVLVDPAKYRRGSRRTVGRMVKALDGILRDHPTDEATSVRRWI